MNLNILTAFQQAILAILILIESIVFVSTFVVIIRRHFSQRELYNLLEKSEAGRKVRNVVDQEGANCSTQSASNHVFNERLAAGCLDDVISRSTDNAVQPTQHGNASLRRRRKSATQPASDNDWKRSHHQTGLGSFPAPWQISGVRKAVHWLFRRMGEQTHEKIHRYFSFVPTLDPKVNFSNQNELPLGAEIF